MGPSLAVAFVSTLLSTQAGAASLGGTYTLSQGDVTLTLVLEPRADGKLAGTLSSTKGTSFRLEGVVEEGVASGLVSGAEGQSLFEAELDGKVLVLTLMEVSGSGEASARSLEFTRSSRGGKVPPAAPAPRAPAAPGPKPGGGGGVSALHRYFAGAYYSFTRGGTLYGSGGTERTLTLCPDGRYHDTYESGAHGGGWGAASERGGGGRWEARGDQQHGVFVFSRPDGSVRQAPYRVLDKGEGTIALDGITFAFSGAPKCD